jgi:hypothetical protein
MIKGGDAILDTDGRQILTNLFFIIIQLLLLFNSRFNILTTYILCSTLIINPLTDKLVKEGYCIEHKSKGIYLIYPALYGERN